MTQKHFNDIAETLASLKPSADASVETVNQWRQTVREFASLCNRYNGNFDSQRFLTACNYFDLVC